MIILDPIAISSPGVFVSSNVPETDDAPAQILTRVYAAGDVVMDAAHAKYESKVGTRSVVTITNASPGVITWPGHSLLAGAPVSFTTTGALPAGLAPNVIYYVLAPAADTFQVSAIPGGAAINTSGFPYNEHTAYAGLNFGRALTDKTYWLPIGATNRWKMFDTYNNTQTENPESITFEVDAKAIAQGAFLGNVEATEIVITSTDPTAGVVYSKTINLQTSTSGSSMFRWLFGRRQFDDYALVLDLPLYYLARAKFEIKNPGGVAKCGMFNIGPIEDIGYSQYGLGTDIKDYSTTRFNFDGTSETTERGFSKRMTLDVVIDNDRIDFIQGWLTARRQRVMVYIGTPERGSTALCGKYSSFKNVIEGFTHSKMALQIEGTV